MTTRRSPGPKGPNPPPPAPLHGLRRPSPPQNPPTPPRPPPQTPPTTKTDNPKGAEKKDDRPEDHIVGTVVHVPFPTGVERGTIRGIHGRKYGAIWVEYPGGTSLHYEVARPLLLPTLEEAKRHQEEAPGAGKKKSKPPTPTNEASNPPNANPTTKHTNPTNPTNPPSGPAKMWNPTMGSHEYEGPDRDPIGHNGHGKHT